MTEMSDQLHKMLQKPEMVVAPFVFDAFQAKIAEAAGFQAVYMTGFGTAASKGYPDVGLLTMAEMVSNVRYIAKAVNIPLICDADTGYGNAINVWRTVQEYEEAGAAALHIEDQVWPKKCGFLSGKQVIPLNDMIPKVKAACDARQSNQFKIIARTDALAVNGWDDVINRVRAFSDAGADLIFVDGIKTVDDVKFYADALKGLPLLLNSRIISVQEAQKYGFKLMINSGTLMALFKAIQSSMSELKKTGNIELDDSSNIFKELVTLLGVDQIIEIEKKYTN